MGGPFGLLPFVILGGIGSFCLPDHPSLLIVYPQILMKALAQGVARKRDIRRVATEAQDHHVIGVGYGPLEGIDGGIALLVARRDPIGFPFNYVEERALLVTGSRPDPIAGESSLIAALDSGRFD